MERVNELIWLLDGGRGFKKWIYAGIALGEEAFKSPSRGQVPGFHILK